MENLTKEDERYLRDLKELLYRINKGHIELNIINNEVDITAQLTR